MCAGYTKKLLVCVCVCVCVRAHVCVTNKTEVVGVNKLVLVCNQII